MRNKIKYLPVFIIFVSLLGCKKIIDVNLKNADIKTVITGEVTDRPGPYEVTVSKSASFTSDNDFPPVSGALVTISGNGVTETLDEKEPGKYFTKNIAGKPGESYTLTVSFDGKTFTASSTMPKAVRLDSLDFVLGRGNDIYPVANFQDPAGVHNYYQFIEFVNGKKLGNGRGNSVFDDRLSDGRYITRTLYNDSADIKTGVTLKVQMNCIDSAVFAYLNELLQISGNGGGFSSPAPANPDSNISGGALGYFSANTVTSKTVQIR